MEQGECWRRPERGVLEEEEEEEEEGREEEEEGRMQVLAVNHPPGTLGIGG
jgi:hypothetical protein